MTDDTPLAALWRFSRMLRLADGPDEVHKMVLARRELNRWSKRAEAEEGGELTPSTPPGRSEAAQSCGRGRRPRRRRSFLLRRRSTSDGAGGRKRILRGRRPRYLSAGAFSRFAFGL